MDNPCWKGYEMIGTKQKGGRTVPNCVKKSKSSTEMPTHLELGSDGKSYNGKAIVVNTMSGKHYSNKPIPMEKAKAQQRVLVAAEKKEKK
jgi:hypothetical protein